jgi:flavin reductase (DIM6/NTAB) family NADH-FMN oxidoreductase RutF
MREIDIKELETKELYQYLTSSITPRPIALVSTINEKGGSNLSPYSFFNVFSIRPPILIFSPVNRTIDNTKKDTLINISKNKECVIGLVTENIAQQVSLASSNFPSEDDEFMKAGLSKQRATAVSPSLIKDSPINFECKVNSIIELGQEGGSGNLVICEVVKIHIDEKLFDSQNNIDPLKLKIVSRLGGSWYGKTNQESLYKMSKPISKIGIGFDHLPVNIKNSSILSGADLAALASVEKIPNKKNTTSIEKNTKEKHILAKKLISEGEIKSAWQELL